MVTDPAVDTNTRCQKKKPSALRVAASDLKGRIYGNLENVFYGQLELPVGCWKAKV